MSGVRFEGHFDELYISKCCFREHSVSGSSLASQLSCEPMRLCILVLSFPCCLWRLIRFLLRAVLWQHTPLLCSCCLEVACQEFQHLTLLMISHLSCVLLPNTWHLHLQQMWLSVCHCWLKGCENSLIWIDNVLFESQNRCLLYTFSFSVRTLRAASKILHC